MQHRNVLKVLILILAIFAQNSSQTATNQSSTVTATCEYAFDNQNRYICTLLNAQITNPSDVLEIVGNHLPGQTDADVDLVDHRMPVFRFHGEVLRKFVNLRVLIFFGTGLNFIHTNAFDVCGRLEELNIMFSGMTTLPSQMLRNCGNLRTFIASESFQLTSIPGDLFGNVRSLETFLVADARLNSLPTNLFENSPNLRTFDVSGNNLSTIDPQMFRNVMNLEEIGISSNQFSDAQAVMNLLSPHQGLRRIRIMNNPFLMFNFNFFSRFQRLEDLVVGGNETLTGITWQALPGTLKTLSVYGIGEEVPENSFNRFLNMTNLLIAGHGITNLHENIFSALTRLERLIIMNTRISTLHSRLFANQENLRLLHLNFNQIEELPEGIFANLVNLGNGNENLHGLFLTANRLQRIPANAFGTHPHLRQISFGNNQINEIQQGVFAQFHTILTVDLRFNICVNQAFNSAWNLDQNRALQTCFSNFEGVQTTTPDGCGNNFRKFEIFTIISVGFVQVLMNLLK